MNLNQRLHDTALESYSRRSNKTTRQSVNEFENLGISPILIKGINRLNFKNTTPIQKESIPAGIRGDDIIAIARTGSGKTLAYGIPMLQRLSESERGSRGIGLVLVPTRELAIQVEESLQAVNHPLHIGTVVLIGGISVSLQMKALKRNPRIIIATPGRLMDLIERKAVNLSKVEIFVLDEADRMLDMGFIPDIKKIMKSIPDKRQTMLFAATMPKEIEIIAGQIMAHPTRIEVDRSGVTPTAISHEMFIIQQRDKSRLLAVQLKQCSGPVLVFTRTKWMARKLTTQVNNMGFATAEIHSNRSLLQRRHALEGFKRGRYQILIATDIAARGIDVTGIELVVNYDMPANSEDYVHRIGRTGRAGKTGHAISFATSAQEGWIKNLERFLKTKLTISALPTLPSERLLIKEPEQLNMKNEYSREEKFQNRKSSKGRYSEVRDHKKSYSEKHALKRVESKRKDFKRKDSNRPESKRRVTKQQNSQPTDLNQNDSNKKTPFWLDFKSYKPTKKKSVGQGNRRKRRARLG